MTEEEKRDTRKEAEILGKLDHPNIIKMKEFFTSTKPELTFNIVAEYADGGDLDIAINSLPKGQFFAENQILYWLAQICMSISYIHKKKIIHRDLKAKNIFLLKNGCIKLGDFGIAKTLQNTWEKAKTMIGTPYYLSPEIVLGKSYSFKSDIWSLGVLLYQMINKKMPFDANSLPMLSLKIMKGDFAPIVNKSYSPDLVAIVKKMLNVDPEKRPCADDILRMTIVKNRITNYLNEINYNKDVSQSIIKLYKEKKKKTGNNINTNSKSNLKHSSSNNENDKSTCTNTPNPTQSSQIPQQDSNHIPVHKNPKVFLKKESNQSNKKNKPNNIKNDCQIEDFFNKKKSENQIVNQSIQNAAQKQSSIHTKNVISEVINPHNPQSNKERPISTPSKKRDENATKKFVDEMRKKNKHKKAEPEIIWGECKVKENKEERQNKNNFPDVILVMKKNTEEDNSINREYINISGNKENSLFLNEELSKNLYNESRMLNNLSKLVESAEDSDKDSELSENIESNETNTQIPERDEVCENFSEQANTNANKSTKIKEECDYDSEFSQIEELKADLEKCLDFDLFIKIYKYVDSNTDSKEVKFNFDLTRNYILNTLAKSNNFSAEQIQKAIEKIYEIFTIVSKERLSSNY